MTAVQIPAPVGMPAPPVTWTRVADGVWAASTRDAFLGTVELEDGRHLAVDGEGVTIGEFARLDDAQARVEHPAGRAYERRARSEAHHIVRERRLAVVTAWVAGVTTVAAIGFMIAGFLP